MALMAILIGVGSVYGIASTVTPLVRAYQHWLNRAWSNEKLDPASAIAVRRRVLSETFDTNRELESQGFDDERQVLLYQLSQQLLGVFDLITLYRRGELADLKALYTEGDKIGWAEPDIDYLLKVSEVIPTAGDIIRYAVREVYTPEIAEAFGQFDGLDEVTNLAKTDLTAAALPPATFRKEWAAHWLLPSIMQGFEMVHRGVIPDKATPEDPLSLERLMTALDIMPAWRDRLTAISYLPFTRVDVRRMHKLGVLDTQAMFTAYADVGFSPYAEGETHVSVAEAFGCEACRHQSKAGLMTNFTLVYNNDPEAAELTIADKERQNERDLTKADVLSGYKTGLLELAEVTSALDAMGYSEDEVAYYIAKADYGKDQEESSLSLSYIKTAYVKGIIPHSEAVEMLGAFNLPDKQVQYLFSMWDLDKKARTQAPTKSELMTFLRNGVMTEGDWESAMLTLGYKSEYITMYKASEEVTRTEKDAIAKTREERDHTRADIVAGYIAKLFDVDDAKSRLLAMGYSENEAQFYINLADYKMEKAESAGAKEETA